MGRHTVHLGLLAVSDCGVSLRQGLTFDRTVSEVSANHVCSIPPETTGDEGWDRFGFLIKLEDFKRKIDERQLLMCIRYSVDGQEWWDSNDGLNYQFLFNKAAPKRAARSSLPPAAMGAHMRASDSASTSLPGIRHNRSVSPGSKISNAFGVSEVSKAAAPRKFVFPKLAAEIVDPPFRSESPVSTLPPASFVIPKLPDIHNHLSLSKYCAPSPPQSPPEGHPFAVPMSSQQTIVPRTSSAKQQADQKASNIVGGQPATLSPPAATSSRERRSSWAGETSDSWDSFTAAMEQVTAIPTVPSTEGDSTPIATGSRSPATGPESSQESSPEARPLALKRSTGDLRALMRDGIENMTPPSSNTSSPASPERKQLPVEPMSPSPTTSTASTGDSSPVRTVSSDSTPDLSNLSISVDPEEGRGRWMTPNNYKMLSNSYQEFVSRERLPCFYAVLMPLSWISSASSSPLR